MRVLWAITRTTMLMALRKPAALLIVLMLALLGPLPGLLMTGDGTLPGVLQLVFTYNFMLLAVVGMGMLLYLSTTVLESEFTGKQIFLLDVKPVSRVTVLAGKWLGLTLLSGLLVVLVGLQTYCVVVILSSLSPADAQSVFPWLVAGWLWILLGGGVVRYGMGRYVTGRLVLTVAFVLWAAVAMGLVGYHIRSTHRAAGPGRPPAELYQTYRQILTARSSFRPELPDVDMEVARYRKRLEEEGRLKSGGRLDDRELSPGELDRHLRMVIGKGMFPIPFGGARTFHFKNLPTGLARSQGLTMRHKLVGHRGEDSAGWLMTGWVFVNPETRQALPPREVKSRSGKTREFHVEALAISDAGEMEVIIYNFTGPEGEPGDPRYRPPARINVPLDDGLEVLLPVGSFEGNLGRGLLLMWVRLIMIAAIGVALNAFVSGPVASFAVFGLLVCGLLNSFVEGAVKPKKIEFLGGSPVQRTLTYRVRQTATLGMLKFLPNFYETDPVQDLVVGRRISYSRIGLQALLDIVLRNGWLIALGLVLYNRREVGLPTSG